MKQFISVTDVADINALIKKAIACKADPLKYQQLGAGKRIGLLFLNPSLRTRLSTQVAARNLGMEAIVFNVDEEGWALEFEEGAIMSGNTVEHIKDAGRYWVSILIFYVSVHFRRSKTEKMIIVKCLFISLLNMQAYLLSVWKVLPCIHFSH